MDENKYRERVSLLRFTISLCGAVAAFLVTVSKDANIEFNRAILSYTLLVWGISMTSGVGAYVLSYREIWYHPRLPEKSIRKRYIAPVEFFFVYLFLVFHPLSLIVALIMTFVLFVT